MARDFNYRFLTQRVTFGTRLRGVAASPLLLMAAVVGVLLVLVPVAVLAGLVVTGNTSDKGALAFVAMLMAMGAGVCFDVLRKSGQEEVLATFARHNGLEHVHSIARPDYAGSEFRSRAAIVLQSVRTPGACFVEVGERFRMTPGLTASVAAAGTPVHPTTSPQAFLRARVAAPADGVSDRLVGPALDEALRRYAGDYRLEVSGPELTVFGSAPLRPREEGRVAAGFALVDELADRAHTLTGGRPVEARGTSAATAPLRTAGPVKVIGLTLALLVVGPLLVAVVMSRLDDALRGDRPLARIVVFVLIGLLLWLVGVVAKRLVTPRRASRR